MAAPPRIPAPGDPATFVVSTREERSVSATRVAESDPPVAGHEVTLVETSTSTALNTPLKRISGVMFSNKASIALADVIKLSETTGFSDAVREIDLDKDGVMDAAELVALLRKFLASKKEGRLFKKVALALVGVCLLQTCLLSAVVVVATYAFKDAYVDSPPPAPPGLAEFEVDNGPMMTSRVGDVLGMREALVSLPLWATPALGLEQLQRVKFLQVSYRDEEGAAGIGDGSD